MRTRTCSPSRRPAMTRGTRTRSRCMANARSSTLFPSRDQFAADGSSSDPYRRPADLDRDTSPIQRNTPLQTPPTQPAHPDRHRPRRHRSSPPSRRRADRASLRLCLLTPRRTSEDRHRRRVGSSNRWRTGQGPEPNSGPTSARTDSCATPSGLICTTQALSCETSPSPPRHGATDFYPSTNRQPISTPEAGESAKA